MAHVFESAPTGRSKCRGCGQAIAKGEVRFGERLPNPRIDGAELAPGSQASCRQCREKIAKGEWRIRLVFHEEGVFSPSGYLHLGCRKAYFEADDILEQVLHFSPGLDEAGVAELRAAFEATRE